MTDKHTASTLDLDDEFGDAFDEDDYGNQRYGNPDEVVLDAEPSRLKRPRVEETRPSRTDTRNMNPPQNHMATPSKPPRPPENDRAAHIERQRQIALEKRNAQLAAQKMQAPSNAASLTSQIRPQQQQQQQQQQDSHQQISSPGVPSQHFNQQQALQEPNLPPIPFDATADQAPAIAAPVGFFSARAVIPEGGIVSATTSAQFNPHSESPSIRKTAGIDHKRSGKVTRDSLAGQASIVAATDPKPLPSGLGSGTGTGSGADLGQARAITPARDFVNPSADMNRRIGLPGGGIASPMMTKSYRPPMKRPPSDIPPPPTTTGGTCQTMTRQPLSDVGNVTPVSNISMANASIHDPKRPKTQMGGTGVGVGTGIENSTMTTSTIHGTGITDTGQQQRVLPANSNSNSNGNGNGSGGGGGGGR